jgi:hypothetical protein
MFAHLGRLLPKPLRATLKAWKSLSCDFGHYQSARLGQCLSREGEPVPWYTYPAVEFLNQLDLSDKVVFEYGSGNSTLFWAKRSRRVIAIENDPSWHAQIKSKLPSNVTYSLIQDTESYVNSVKAAGAPDIIIIDGMHRAECAAATLGKLASGGFYILDNADWHPEASALLRGLDLIEIDMAGFGPINHYTWTTSFYFSRNVRLPSNRSKQPSPGIGSIQVN